MRVVTRHVLNSMDIQVWADLRCMKWLPRVPSVAGLSLVKRRTTVCPPLSLTTIDRLEERFVVDLRLRRRCGDSYNVPG